MDISIRPAGDEDAAAISRLSYQLGYAVDEPATLENLKAVNKNENEVVYVALDHKEVIGWIHVFDTVRLESGSFCEIGGLVVDDRYRGKGIGRMLIDHVKSWCVNRKVSRLRLRSNVIRDRAHTFYRNLGFIETKQQKVFEITLRV